jgi:toxin FitB
MIILDTNVLSEMARQAPAPAVVAWLDAQAPETLYLTTITLAEMRFGMMILPDGRRRAMLQSALAHTAQLYAGRILPFDQDAAWRYAELAAAARAHGLGFPTPDGYIAAIAAVHSFDVATRDTGPFAAAGLTVIDPFIPRPSAAPR